MILKILPQQQFFFGHCDRQTYNFLCSTAGQPYGDCDMSTWVVRHTFCVHNFFIFRKVCNISKKTFASQYVQTNYSAFCESLSSNVSIKMQEFFARAGKQGIHQGL